MSKTVFDQTLALAGVFQAAKQVQNVARQGRVDTSTLTTCLQSIFIVNAQTTEEVYGGLVGVRDGLSSLIANMDGGPRTRDAEQARYVISLLHLERKLSSHREFLNAISKGIENTRPKVEMFSLTHDNVVAALADIYVNTVSTFTPRIMVAGEHGHLNHADNANRVRALLLAGIRSAVLWTQSGGGRLKLLFQRRRYVEEAKRLLRGLEEQPAQVPQ